MPEQDKCLNPWIKTKEGFKERQGRVCGRTDIVVVLMKNGERLPICSECWKEIADSELEWTENPESVIKEK